MKKRPKTGFYPGARVFSGVTKKTGTVTKIRAAGRKFPVVVEWDNDEGLFEYTALGGIVPKGNPTIFLLPDSEQPAPTRFYPGARVVWDGYEGLLEGIVETVDLSCTYAFEVGFPSLRKFKGPASDRPAPTRFFTADGRYDTWAAPSLALALPKGWIAGPGLGSKSTAAQASCTPAQVAYIFDEPPAPPAEEIPDLGDYVRDGAAFQAEIDQYLAQVPAPPDGTEDKKSENPNLCSAPCSPRRLFQAGDRVKVKGRLGVHEVKLNPLYPISSDFPYIVQLLHLSGEVQTETFTDTGHWTFGQVQEGFPPVLELAVPAPPPRHGIHVGNYLSLTSYIRALVDFQESQHDYAVATDTVRCWLEDWSREGRDLARATWYSIDENTPQDQLPEHGARLLVEDGEGRVFYAIYSGYLNFDVHHGVGPRIVYHRHDSRWCKHGTGFVKKFMVLPLI